MNAITVQDKLFMYLKESVSTETSLPDVISEVLNISTDSAYRRIRGETPLIIEEVLTICRHFKLSMDQLLENRANMVVCRNTRVDNEVFNYSEYLKELKKQLYALEQLSSKQLLYMSK